MRVSVDGDKLETSAQDTATGDHECRRRRQLDGWIEVWLQLEKKKVILIVIHLLRLCHA